MDIVDHIARAEVQRYALETLIHYHLSAEGGRYKYIICDHEERLAGFPLLLAKQVEGTLYVKWGTLCSETDPCRHHRPDIAPISFRNGSW